MARGIPTPVPRILQFFGTKSAGMPYRDQEPPVKILCMNIWAIVPFVFFLGSVPAWSQPVRVESGLTEGVREGEITVYKSIPFAAPPVGPLRWKAPEPALQWKGVRR